MLIKMGFLDDRPECVRAPCRPSPPLTRPRHHHDARWAETGDRYLIKLFRDFVFHTVNDDETANVDFGHVVDCLNKVPRPAPEPSPRALTARARAHTAGWRQSG
jgi:hypothetical protein